MTKTITNRRMTVRYEVNGQTTCPFVLSVVEDLGEARIKDVSAEGIGMFWPCEIELGTLLAIGLSNPAQDFFRTQIVQVVHCTRLDGGYIVGGVFLKPLTYEELRSLVM